jgi:hypothetical protein
MHALPVEGLTGRLVVDTLVHYLNVPGAAIVIVSMVVIALYLSTTFSFSTAQQWMAIRFAFALAWRDRMRNWRSAWAKARAEKKAAKREALRAGALLKAQKAAEKNGGKQAKRAADEERIPNSRRAAFEDVSAAEAASMPDPHAPTLWNQMPRTSIPDRELEPLELRDRLRSAPSKQIPAAGCGEIAPAGTPAFRTTGRAYGNNLRKRAGRRRRPAGHPGAPFRQRLPLAAQHSAAPQRRVADRARRRSAQSRPGFWSRNARSSTCAARWCRSIPARWSPPSNSALKPASSTAA